MNSGTMGVYNDCNFGHIIKGSMISKLMDHLGTAERNCHGVAGSLRAFLQAVERRIIAVMTLSWVRGLEQ